MEPKFFDPHSEIVHTGNRLPHWQQRGATYFLTFRVADSIPAAKLAIWQEERSAWLRSHPMPWSREVQEEHDHAFPLRIERWLDSAQGDCPLRDEEHARIVGSVLAHFEGTRCLQHAWVVMPNHVHTLTTLHPDWTLESLVSSWKTFSARHINASMQREGPLWARDYFDRIIRDQDHFWKCARYIHRNPSKAQLPPDAYLLYEDQTVRSQLDTDS